LWNRRLDKKLVFTDRVKRFFIFISLYTIFFDVVIINARFGFNDILIPIILSLISSAITEKLIFMKYKKMAQKKLKSIDNLNIIAITASFGKTSIKNFLHTLLDNSYKTPRSVNTIGGIIKDINELLPTNISYYIVEAGAREKGDIEDIATLLNPQYIIIGSIGEQHIEYFKTLDNIKATKSELFLSKNLKKAIVSQSLGRSNSDKTFIFDEKNLIDTKSSLDGISFGLNVNDKIEYFEAPVLGLFNATNIALSIYMAIELGVDIDTIKERVKKIKSVEHRLQKIESNGKIIIDDAFNGNFEGIKEGANVCATYSGRKVVITPGIVECDADMNEKLAIILDDIFDIVIITGKQNSNIISSNIKKAKKIILEDKSELKDVLANNTKIGDLIYFANDAPNFI
jgi:UDP-N-acetylmuramoyl-tripeptide--D-alanyl-D-alanine ligase